MAVPDWCSYQGSVSAGSSWTRCYINLLGDSCCVLNPLCVCVWLCVFFSPHWLFWYMGAICQLTADGARRGFGFTFISVDMPFRVGESPEQQAAAWASIRIWSYLQPSPQFALLCAFCPCTNDFKWLTSSFFDAKIVLHHILHVLCDLVYGLSLLYIKDNWKVD